MSDNKTYFNQQANVASQKYMNADGDNKDKETSTFNKFMKDISAPILIGMALLGLYIIFREKK